MSAPSVVAFGLVFFGASVFASIVLIAALHLLRSPLRQMGPSAERRAAATSLLLPPFLGVGLVGALAVQSIAAYLSGTDHCLAHDHHLHLCLWHGAPWAMELWAVASLVLVTTYVLVRTGLSVWAHLWAQRAVNRLRRVGSALNQPSSYRVPSDDRFAFSAGIFSPAVILSSAAWDALDDSERAAILAHERAHLARRDLVHRFVLSLAALVGAPYLVARALRFWELASERICDRHAAQAVGRPSVVASAMLALVRADTKKLAPAGAIFAAASHVPERIRALFEEENRNEALHARRLSRAVVLSVVASAVGCALAAEPIHHLLETILG